MSPAEYLLGLVALWAPIVLFAQRGIRRVRRLMVASGMVLFNNPMVVAVVVTGIRTGFGLVWYSLWIGLYHWRLEPGTSLLAQLRSAFAAINILYLLFALILGSLPFDDEHFIRAQGTTAMRPALTHRGRPRGDPGRRPSEQHDEHLRDG
jgi:hypothetical protein